MWVKISASLFLVSMLAACGQHGNDEAVRQNVTSEQANLPASDVSQCDPGQGFYAPLPEGVRLDFPFHFRSDRIFENSRGQLRHRVTLEIVEGSAAVAYARAREALITAGYAPHGKERVINEGAKSQVLAKPGETRIPRILLAYNDNVGERPANPASRGLIYFDWPERTTSGSGHIAN